MSCLMMSLSDRGHTCLSFIFFCFSLSIYSTISGNFLSKWFYFINNTFTLYSITFLHIINKPLYSPTYRTHFSSVKLETFKWYQLLSACIWGKQLEFFHLFERCSHKNTLNIIQLQYRVGTYTEYKSETGVISNKTKIWSSIGLYFLKVTWLRTFGTSALPLTHVLLLRYELSDENLPTRIRERKSYCGSPLFFVQSTRCLQGVWVGSVQVKYPGNTPNMCPAWPQENTAERRQEGLFFKM